jgi:hypothetical protein
VEWAGLDNYLVEDEATGEMMLEVRPQGRGGEVFLYEANYGNMQCKPHDQGLEPFCDGKFPPSWCFESWCFVDPGNCDKTSVRSKYFRDEEIYYSYGACGSSNAWDEWYAQGGAESADILGDMIELVEDYVKSNKDAAEASASGTCGSDSSCPCTDCSPSGRYWPGEKVNFEDISVLPGGNEDDPLDGDGTCIAQSVATTYLNVASKEYDDKERIAYQYFGHQASGGYAQWPKMDLKNMCTNYDPRFRDWYTAAATGPKDVVLVLDKSGSMGQEGRMGLAYKAAMAVVDTFSEYDYVGIVLFSNEIMSFRSMLVPATAEYKSEMRSYIETNFVEGGGTNFRDSLGEAFKILQASVDASMTSTCNRAIMFLTDGETDFYDDDYAMVTRESEKNSVAVLTYAIGSGAAEDIVSRLACENRGVFYKVEDGGDLKTVMSKYFVYFATGSRSCTVRWVGYQDVLTKEHMLAGCLPFYSSQESSGKGQLRGVSCVELSMVAPLSQVRASPQYNLFECMTEMVSRQCEALYLRDCDLAELRAEAGSTCPGDTPCSPASDGYCVDPTCKDDITYKDSGGYYCDQWVGDDCTNAYPGWKDWGYTQADEDEILEKCPYSCKMCKRVDSADLCDGATCEGVTGNVGCRDRIVGGSSANEGGDEDSTPVAALAAMVLLTFC